jgi:GH15 family glucan-1,4-alpha-glucosidase
MACRPHGRPTAPPRAQRTGSHVRRDIAFWHDLAEETLGHFPGWRDSRPVRIGNGPADQLQIDIYGEAWGGVFLGDAHGVEIDHEGWLAVSDAIDWVCEHWD